jgi:cobalt-zinc-cadmium efflux system outer membrane protein
MNSSYARAWAACSLFFCGSSVFAADPTPASITLEQAVAAAIKHNPELATFEFQMRAQDARIRQSALRPAPELSVEVENALGSGEFQGIDSAETTFAISQVFELGGKRNARLVAAQGARSLLDAQKQVRQLDLLAAVTERFITVAGRQEELKLSQLTTQLAETTVTGAQRRVDAARSPHAELDRARIALDRAKLEEGHALAELEAARSQLAATWGESQPVLDGQPLSGIRADLFSMPPTADFETLNARLAMNPDLLLFASEARLRDAELRLAATLRKPDIAVGVGARRFEATNNQAFVASFSIPLYTGRRSEGFVAEAQAQRDLVDADRRVAEVQARVGLYRLHKQLSQAVLEANTLRTNILPRTQEALRETQYAYERGRYSYLELVDAQREYLSAQGSLIAASMEAHTLRAEIERLTNTPAFETP